MTISSWILSIVGISILSVLLDLFLPEGQMNGHIKNVFNFAIILVIVAPLPKFISSSYNAENLFDSNEIVLQEDYIYQLNRDKLTYLEQSIENKPTMDGFLNVDISISADIFTTNLVIETVFVDLSNLVIEPKSEHIDIEKEVIDAVSKYISIKKECIVLSG